MEDEKKKDFFEGGMKAESYHGVPRSTTESHGVIESNTE